MNSLRKDFAFQEYYIWHFTTPRMFGWFGYRRVKKDRYLPPPTRLVLVHEKCPVVV